MEAINTPILIEIKAHLIGIPKIMEARQALYAPVVGNGTAVNRIKPSAPYFFTCELLLIVLS